LNLNFVCCLRREVVCLKFCALISTGIIFGDEIPTVDDLAEKLEDCQIDNTTYWRLYDERVTGFNYKANTYTGEEVLFNHMGRYRTDNLEDDNLYDKIKDEIETKNSRVDSCHKFGKKGCF